MPNSKNHLITELSKKEFEILQKLAIGLTYKEIAEELQISLDTVKKHCSHTYKKLTVRNKTEAIMVLQKHLSSSEPR